MTEFNDPFEESALTSILVVSNLADSKEFYLNILGAEIYREYGGDSMVLKFLSHWLLLVTPGGPTKDKPSTVFLPPKKIDEVSHSFTIRVNDCLKSYEVLKKRGAKFIAPPVKNGAETRCFFRDPDGHLFEISSYKS